MKKKTKSKKKVTMAISIDQDLKKELHKNVENISDFINRLIQVSFHYCPTCDRKTVDVKKAA